VAHSTVRFAAGAGVLAASLLIAGPNPAHAVADKHGSGAHAKNDNRKNGSGSPLGDVEPGVANPVEDALQVGGTADTDLTPPSMNLSVGGTDLEDPAVVTGLGTETLTALRSAAVVEQPPGDNVSAAVPRAGSGYSGRPVATFRAPKVVVGNGRTPGTHVPMPGPAAEAVLTDDAMVSPAAVPAAPGVPAAIEINFPPLPPPMPPVERIRPAHLTVGEYGTGTTDTVADPLAGVAGLVLIPAIGAVLGYRQARAAQSLRESLRS
jgi:hypothetical protein